MPPQIPTCTDCGGGGGGGLTQPQVEQLAADAAASAVGNIVAGAPALLNTLDELAAALGDNPLAVQQIQASIADLGDDIAAVEALIPAAPKGREEHVFDVAYYDTVGWSGTYNTASQNVLSSPVSPNIANPFAGSDIIVTASIMLPMFTIFTEGVDQTSQIGRSSDLRIAVGAAQKSQRSWPIHRELTLARDPFMPDPLNAARTNGLGGQTISEVIEVAASGAIIEIDFQDYLNTMPGNAWTLYGYRVPVFAEAAGSHARLHVTIQEV